MAKHVQNASKPSKPETNQVKSGDKPKKEKVKRSAYPFPKGKTQFAEAVQFGKFNEKGEFIVTDGQYSPKLHLPLKKKDFENSADFLDFQSGILDYRGQQMVARAKSLRGRAVKFRTLGDEKSRKSVSKLQRLQKQRAELEAQLRSELGDEAVDNVLNAGN